MMIIVVLVVTTFPESCCVATTITKTTLGCRKSPGANAAKPLNGDMVEHILFILGFDLFTDKCPKTGMKQLITTTSTLNVVINHSVAMINFHE